MEPTPLNPPKPCTPKAATLQALDPYSPEPSDPSLILTLHPERLHTYILSPKPTPLHPVSPKPFTPNLQPDLGLNPQALNLHPYIEALTLNPKP